MVHSFPIFSLSQITVEVKGHGVVYTFPCERWLSKKDDDGLLERELMLSATDSKVTDVAASYIVQLFTSDVHGAGTDAHVSLTLYGEDGKTETQELNNKTNNFERKKVCMRMTLTAMFTTDSVFAQDC